MHPQNEIIKIYAGQGIFCCCWAGDDYDLEGTLWRGISLWPINGCGDKQSTESGKDEEREKSKRLNENMT